MLMLMLMLILMLLYDGDAMVLSYVLGEGETVRGGVKK